MEPIRVVLFPTDFSECSAAAFHVACSLAAHYDAKLAIVHVKEPPLNVGATLGLEPIMLPIPETEAEHKQIEKKLLDIQPSNPSFGVQHHLLSGWPADEIVRASRAFGGDIIVMGTHGRGGLSRALMGSVAAAVTRKATCPVLTVKLPRVKPTRQARRRTNKQPTTLIL